MLYRPACEFAAETRRRYSHRYEAIYIYIGFIVNDPHNTTQVTEVLERLRLQLEACFHPWELNIQDDGAKHVGHTHAGAGHFSVRIVAPVFAPHSQLQRHRMVYAALGNLLQTGVHALSIKALAPEELH
jgi:BolA family transcriptional regulator, general stress-responsive regulator